jgi:hypothetical protein
MARSYRVRSRVARLPILATSTSNGRLSCRKWSPNSSFSFTWHPYAVDPKTDYSNETPTLVEFRLEKTTSGTLLLLTESGFDKIPSDRRLEAFRMNDGGWTEQMKNIQNHVTQTS